jgi:serine/threonine protein kinase
MESALADALLGQVLDRRYHVRSRIAHGGMATVYLATDKRLDRQVALKVMHAELARDEEFVSRFIGEAKSVARLSHPNVVAVFDQGSDGQYLYLAMEYVPGRTLRSLLRERGAFPPDAALGITEPILSGLAAAHAAGIVHRDVKPENAGPTCTPLASCYSSCSPGTSRTRATPRYRWRTSTSTPRSPPLLTGCQASPRRWTG